MSSLFPFIVLEGCDGVGKTTIRDMIKNQLEDLNYNCAMFGQHSWLEVESSRIILDIRTSRRQHTIEKISHAYFKDKQLHAQYNIMPALKSSIVICDRYIFSDAVYQEVLYGIPAQNTIDKHKHQGTLFPDILIYVWADVATAYKRIKERAKNIRHYEKPTEMKEIIQGYKNLLYANTNKNETYQLIGFNNNYNVKELKSRIQAEIISSICKHTLLNNNN